ncbi:hypothetical protein B6I99_13215 [Klebsiella quasipneumoniae]|nr:hypothetical protein B6I99_13215 [Klebsiella quasipneumoniae]
MEKMLRAKAKADMFVVEELHEKGMMELPINWQEIWGQQWLSNTVSYNMYPSFENDILLNIDLSAPDSMILNHIKLLLPHWRDQLYNKNIREEEYKKFGVSDITQLWTHKLFCLIDLMLFSEYSGIKLSVNDLHMILYIIPNERENYRNDTAIRDTDRKNAMRALTDEFRTKMSFFLECNQELKKKTISQIHAEFKEKQKRYE